jgi:hypothetical protein
MLPQHFARRIIELHRFLCCSFRSIDEVVFLVSPILATGISLNLFQRGGAETLKRQTQGLNLMVSEKNKQA